MYSKWPEVLASNGLAERFIHLMKHSLKTTVDHWANASLPIFCHIAGLHMTQQVWFPASC